jgi:uncharacterized membrane protein
MDWRKYNLVEYKKGSYRLERQTWGFGEWCLLLFAISLLWSLRGWLLLILATGFGLVVSLGIALAVLSLRDKP